MAERLEHYEFRGLGRRPTYPWDEWLDGSTWRITRGADFDSQARAMVKLVHHAARRRGQLVATQIEGDSVIFRAKARG